MIRIYNTLSGKKEELPTLKGKKLRLFVCGPTVYDYSHIGHARTYIFFDFLARYLKKRGYKLFYLQNITDVDDKIIKRAEEEKKDPLKLALHFTREYLKDMKTIGITAVNTYAPATKHIPEIIKQVQALIKKGYVYKIEGDGYYYDISKFADYGKLSRRTTEQAEDGVSRIDESIKKRNKGDFCVWKFSKPGEPTWDSPLGAGRPGWHIEDTAISEKYFGPQYELHGGGMDLKFPHHEAEIAQQEAASGKKPFVKLWIHIGMLTVRGEKMAKSLKNFVTIREYLEKHRAVALRFAFMSHHYKTPVNYEESLINNAESALYRAWSFLGALELVAGHKRQGGKKVPITYYSKEFFAALHDDLNTPRALAALFALINEAGQSEVIFDLSRETTHELKKFITDSFELFQITFPKAKISLEVKKLAVKRELSRKNKQFTLSDTLRKEINALGYIIEDTPLGPFIWPKSFP